MPSSKNFWVLQIFFWVKLYQKGKAVPLQAWSDPEGSRNLMFPDFMTKVKQSSYRPGVTQRVPGI
jgi:hypothetical protein